MIRKENITPLGVLSYRNIHGIFVRTGIVARAHFCIFWNDRDSSFKIKSREVVIQYQSGAKENPRSCGQFHFSEGTNGWTVSYIKTEKGKKFVVIAETNDIYLWTVKSVLELKDRVDEAVLITDPARKSHSLYFGGLFVTSAESSDLKNWTHRSDLLFTSRIFLFDAGLLTLMGGDLITSGHLIVYDASHKSGGLNHLAAGAILFDPVDHKKILWRCEVPIWQGVIHSKDEHLVPLGVLFGESDMTLYWASEEGSIISAIVKIPSGSAPPLQRDKLYLKKFHKNPILEPHPHNEWESEAVFNPAAVYDGGRVHLLYRAIGKSSISVLGYASSKDGLHFDIRHNDPAYFPRDSFEGVYVKGPTSFTDIFASGGGWGGCEDPKLTRIGERLYLTYVAFNGWEPPRIALSSIARDDFLARRWRWAYPKLISKPGVIDKSGSILPEKIDGKFVVFHRIFPDILIDFVDSLDFKKGEFLKGEYKIPTRPDMWDSRKLSIGAPPIKTKDGWLVIYHAIDDRDSGKYKIGAMILDLENPTKVLFRTNHPILIPDAHYENHGKPGVAYPCGAVILDKTLFVYYGGGDRVVCVATAPLSEFMENVKKDKVISLNIDPSSIITI